MLRCRTPDAPRRLPESREFFLTSPGKELWRWTLPGAIAWSQEAAWAGWFYSCILAGTLGLGNHPLSSCLGSGDGSELGWTRLRPNWEAWISPRSPSLADLSFQGGLFYQANCRVPGACRNCRLWGQTWMNTSVQSIVPEGTFLGHIWSSQPPLELGVTFAPISQIRKQDILRPLD